MIRRKLIHLAVGLSLFLLGSVSTASALSVVDENLQHDPQLYITGYQRDETGKGLLFFQLYNNYDTPVDLRDWRFYTDQVDDTHEIFFAAERPDGYVRPKGHTVVSAGGYVAGASFGNLDAKQFENERTAAIIVVSPQGAERTMTYALRYEGDSTKATNDDYFDGIWLRSQSVSGGYNTSFAVMSSETLLDNGLYYKPLAPAVRIVEVYAYSSDCAPGDGSPLCGDYIKLQAEGSPEQLSHYVVRTSNSSTSRTATNTFYLEDYAANDGYITVAVNQNGERVSLTNSSGYIWLEDIYGLSKYDDTMVRYELFGSAQQGYSWIPDETDALRKGQWSTTPRPGGPNLITLPVEEIKTCPAGKYLNPDTNRCRTIEEAVNALAACAEGQYRNPATNRCKQLVTTASTLKSCGEGQERNPATNRCRSIASAVAELIPCNDGYERNPATNRCRKVSAVLAASAGSGGESNGESEPSNPLALWGWALAAVAGTGAVGYGIYEWRHELAGGWKSLKARLGRK